MENLLNDIKQKYNENRYQTLGTQDYEIGDILEVSVIKKSYIQEQGEQVWQLIAKFNGVTCFIAPSSAVAPVWGGVFQAKVIKINPSSLVVNLTEQTGIFKQPTKGWHSYRDERGNYFVYNDMATQNQECVRV